eukprot:7377123-Prymnesium_polylepis.1
MSSASCLVQAVGTQKSALPSVETAGDNVFEMHFDNDSRKLLSMAADFATVVPFAGSTDHSPAADPR